jgi:hypothetical protein
MSEELEKEIRETRDRIEFLAEKIRIDFMAAFASGTHVAEMGAVANAYLNILRECTEVEKDRDQVMEILQAKAKFEIRKVSCETCYWKPSMSTYDVMGTCRICEKGSKWKPINGERS